MFSILIPLYNKERYLSECIDSILAQECQSKFEVIILDDGSTDRSKTIVEKFVKQDARVRLFCQKNEGPLYARKRLLDYASGEWCIFADADDYWKQGLLKALENTIRDNVCDMVCFGTVRIYKGAEEAIKIPIRTETVFKGEDKKRLYKLALKHPNLLAIWNKAFRREIINTNLYENYREMRYGEDRVQVLQLWRTAEKIIYLPENLYCYRAMEGSLTQVIRIERFENMQKYAKTVELFLEQEGMNTEENLQILYTDLAEDFLDGIFKCNCTTPGREKKTKLQSIRNLPYYEMLERSVDLRKLKSYQRVRFLLVKHKAYQGLIMLDWLLYAIKKIFIKREIYGN